MKTESIKLDNLLSNTAYRVCIKCKQVFSDPDGLEVCQDTRTPSNRKLLFKTIYFRFITIDFRDTSHCNHRFCCGSAPTYLHCCYVS